MPRPPRIEYPGSIQHVVIRGNDGERVFLDDADHRSFLSILRRAGDLARWELLSYCLMVNHVHLLIRMGERGISRGMHSVMTTHSHRFNAVHERTGHLFGRRYWADDLVEHDSVIEIVRYIALNPWRARMTNTPDEWRWSSHRALAGLSPVPHLLAREATLELFDGAQRYHRFVNEGERDIRPPKLVHLVPEGVTGMRKAAGFGYSQADIARAFGVSQATVSRRLRP